MQNQNLRRPRGDEPLRPPVESILTYELIQFCYTLCIKDMYWNILYRSKQSENNVIYFQRDRILHFLVKFFTHSIRLTDHW